MRPLRKITLLDGAVTMRGLQSRDWPKSRRSFFFFEYQEYNSIKFNMLLLSSQRKISSNMLRSESISRILRTADSDRVFYWTMPFKQRSVASHVTAEEIGSDSAVIHDQHRVTVLVSHISCCVMVGYWGIGRKSELQRMDGSSAHGSYQNFHVRMRSETTYKPRSFRPSTITLYTEHTEYIQYHKALPLLVKTRKAFFANP